MRRDGFYRADQGKALPSRPCPGTPSRHQRSSLSHSNLQNLTGTTFRRGEPNSLTHNGGAGLVRSSIRNRHRIPEEFEGYRTDRLALTKPRVISNVAPLA